jgi:acetoin utilization deacetylase AcuC-like enzyme
VPPERLHDPPRAPAATCCSCTRRVRGAGDDGTLPHAEQRRIGLPWSEAFVERAYRVVRGTCEAAEAALQHGVAMNLAGGTHHAFPHRGEGFCTFNDVAVAVRRLQRSGTCARVRRRPRRAPGERHARLLRRRRERVHVLMHGAKNFPFHKVPGTLDVELDDGAGDDAYLALLAEHLPRVLRDAAPDLVVYLAGADPHEGDRLGRPAAHVRRLVRRDWMVLEACREVGLPVCVTIAGGYGRDVRDTVRVHVNTVGVAARFA